jgi:hypothetical protein
VHYEFPGTLHTAGKRLKLTWRDGEGHRPPFAALGLPARFRLPESGSVLRGEKGTLVVPHVAAPRLFNAEGGETKVEMEPPRNHYLAFADACRDVGTTTSHFDYAGPLTEAVLLGAIAIRVPDTTLQWDAAALKITNSTAADALVRKKYRKGWEPAWIS